MKKNLTV